jgi:hypothetical protein
MTASSLAELKIKFQTLLNRIVLRLAENGLLNNQQELHEIDRAFLGQILNDQLADKNLPDALFRLTKILRTLNKKEVVVLIDEYDTPTSYATRHGYFSEVCSSRIMSSVTHPRQANEFFRDVFSPLLKVRVFEFFGLIVLSRGCRITEIFEGFSLWVFCGSPRRAGCQA